MVKIKSEVQIPSIGRLSTRENFFSKEIQVKIHHDLHGNFTNMEKCGNNALRTGKYTPVSFIPLNFFYQFTKLANIFFLLISVMQFIKPVTITNGVPTVLPALILIIALSMLKDFLEDLKRWRND